HHEGFSMFDTKTRVKRRVRWTGWKGPRIEACDVAYSIMETPFHRDVVKELCDAAHQHNIRIDLYFSHPDWYDADFRPYGRHPLTMNDVRIHPEKYNEQFQRMSMRVPVPTDEETQHMVERHRTQLIELLSNYGPIDMMCLDNWLGPAVWPQVRETLLQLRQIQPDVMFRGRGIGNYGDYYTPEGFVPDNPSNTSMPWMVIHPLGKTFSYDPRAKRYKGPKWVIHQLVDAVSKGGNFMVGIGPDKNGKFHPEAIKQLEAVGTWLQINGEGIYDTRMWTKGWKEGDGVRFTAAKDQKTVYAFILQWPDQVFRSKVLRPREGSEVFVLGVNDPLNWRMENGELVIELPNSKPCDYAWGFRIEI
ncbi:MAG TPA: alpha-L-fucosidase, partial [Candidatus Lokiarchaeia archaeon]|nr:alpha-L-fucosidase [Candidatus Lokiarchaeia archaeon]